MFTFGDGVDDMPPEAKPTSDADVGGDIVATVVQGRKNHLFEDGAGASISRSHVWLREASTSVLGDLSPVQLMRRGPCRNTKLNPSVR